MSTTTEILIQLRRDTKEVWEQNPSVVLEHGEPAVIFNAKRDLNGNIIYKTDATGAVTTIPQPGTLRMAVIGNGYSTIEQLMKTQALYPVRLASFNSEAAGTIGQDRSVDDPTKTNATLGYQTFDEWLYDYNHPYSYPAFTSFGPAGQTLEIGVNYDPNKTYTWNSSNLKNVKAASVTISQIFNGLTSTLASGLNGASPTGGLPVTGKTMIKGTALDQQAIFQLDGRNTKEQAMAAAKNFITWKGKVAWFMHPNTEWLVPGMVAGPGEPAGNYNADDLAVATICNTPLNGSSVFGSSAHQFGALTVDGTAAGGRFYLLYPKGYRTSFEVIDPASSAPYALVKTREITLSRNGVNVPYILAGLDMTIIQQLNIIAR